MEWGRQEEFLIQMMESTGVEPKALQSKPQLYHWMPSYLKAFNLLSGCRDYGMAANPINLPSMESYIRLFEVDDVEDFIKMICSMDAEFLANEGKKMEQRDKSKSKEKK